MRELERWMALRAVNSKWMEHLANMDYLRAGIGAARIRTKGPPCWIYQKEAFDEFERMQQAIQDDIVRNVMRIQIVYEPPPEPKRPTVNIAPAIPLPDNLPKYSGPSMDPPRALTTNLGADIGAGRGKDGAPPNWKGGRNDACWCGSGQKYKKCHGK